MAEWFDDDAEDLRVLIGDVLRRKRREHALSQGAAAIKADIGSQAIWGRIEGGFSVSFETYAKAAEAVGMSLRELIAEAVKS